MLVVVGMLVLLNSGYTFLARHIQSLMGLCKLIPRMIGPDLDETYLQACFVSSGGIWHELLRTALLCIHHLPNTVAPSHCKSFHRLPSCGATTFFCSEAGGTAVHLLSTFCWYVMARYIISQIALVCHPVLNPAFATQKGQH